MPLRQTWLRRLGFTSSFAPLPPPRSHPVNGLSQDHIITASRTSCLVQTLVTHPTSAMTKDQARLGSARRANNTQTNQSNSRPPAPYFEDAPEDAGSDNEYQKDGFRYTSSSPIPATNNSASVAPPGTSSQRQGYEEQGVIGGPIGATAQRLYTMASNGQRVRYSHWVQNPGQLREGIPPLRSPLDANDVTGDNSNGRRVRISHPEVTSNYDQSGEKIPRGEDIQRLSGETAPMDRGRERHDGSAVRQKSYRDGRPRSRSRTRERSDTGQSPGHRDARQNSTRHGKEERSDEGERWESRREKKKRWDSGRDEEEPLESRRDKEEPRESRRPRRPRDDTRNHDAHHASGRGRHGDAPRKDSRDRRSPNQDSNKRQRNGGNMQGSQGGNNNTGEQGKSGSNGFSALAVTMAATTMGLLAATFLVTKDNHEERQRRMGRETR